MTNLFILVAATLGALSLAGEGWICEEMASERVGNEIRACGVGQGADENAARLAAFDNSKKEFERICNGSSDCNHHRINIVPQRTTCERTAAGVKCYRMITFAIGPIDSGTARASKQTTGTKAARRMASRPGVSMNETQEVFPSFTFEQIASLPHVSKGMSKARLLKQFGAPISAEENFGDLQMMYSGQMCEFNQSCFVHVKDGVVESFSDFKPQYTDLLQ